METESILQYLLEIIQTKNIGNMSKLASLSIINSLLLKQTGNKVKKLCLNSSFAASLLSLVESGLNKLGDPSDYVCVSVAMEILNQYSKLPVSDLDNLNCESVIRCLLEYLDINGRFFRYPSSAKVLMVNLCEGQQLMGKVKVVSMSSETLNYIHKHTDHKFARVPDRIKLCRLINTQTEADVDVRHSLLQQDVVWPGQFPGAVVSDADDVWHNIIVTKVLDGGMFWAQVGDETIKSVTDIQSHLNGGTQHCVSKSRASIDDCVVVYGEIMGCACYLRAQVKSYNDCYVDVFCVDFGHSLTIHDKYVYMLPEDLCVKKVKRKISLCSIDGISPPPQCEELVYNSAAILVNLCRQSQTAGEIICKLNGIEVMFKFIEQCNKPKLKAQMITIMLNMVSINRRTCLKYGNDIVTLLLGVVKSYVGTRDDQIKATSNIEELEHSFSDDETLLMARCVMVLTNILYTNQQLRDIFYQNEGIDLTLRLMYVCGRRKDALYMMCARLLKVFTRESGSDKITVTKSSAIGLLKQIIRDQKLIESSEKDAAQNKPTNSIIQQAKEVLCDSDQESIDTETISCHDHKPRECLSDVDGKKYYLGSRVDVHDDELHEIIPERSGKNIHQLTFAKHVCGMLNNGKGGTIYFGIDENHRVFGLELTRDEKDQFRLGVDRLVNGKITPILLHSKYNIKTIPVLDPTSHEVVPDHYVIEISVKSSRGVIYTIAGDGSCYYRFGSDTFSLTKQELRNLVAMDEESFYKDEILRLKNMKDELLEPMNTF